MAGSGIILPIMPFYDRYFQGNAVALGFLMSTYSSMQSLPFFAAGTLALLPVPFA